MGTGSHRNRTTVVVAKNLGKVTAAGGTIARKARRDAPFADRGLALGLQAPSFEAVDHDGQVIRLGDSIGYWRILTFISPECYACENTVGVLHTVLQDGLDIKVLVIGGLAHEANYTYAIKHNASMSILTPDPDLAKKVYLVRGVPFTYIIDDTGTIRAKGVVNEREHLQRLLVNAEVPISILYSH